MNDLITKKIEELIELCEDEGDTNSQQVLLILQGARLSGDDNFLAAKMVEFTKDVLLPLTQSKKELKKSFLN